MAVRRRAGRTTILDETPLPPATQLDTRPQLSGAAARYVGLAFDERPSLAPEILELVRRSGRRLPDEWLPELMGLAARTDDADALVDLGGPRAAWLAGMVPDLAGDTWWGTADDWDDAWAAATSGAARAGLVRRFREQDIDRARRSLTGWWSDLASEQRARVLAALQANLDPADEPFLDRALEDRRADVRRAAADLLVQIPDSSLAHRLEEQARPLLASGGRVRKTIKVTLPAPAETFETLGFGGRPMPGFGERAWLLRSILAHIRPARWTEWLGSDAPALVAQAARSDEARSMLEGWMKAVERFGDPAWATALLRDKGVSSKVMLGLGVLLERLTPAERAQVVAESAAELDPAELAGLAAAVPAPWPSAVGDAVLSAARAGGREHYPGPGHYELVRAAALRLPPDRADELEAAASFKGERRPALTDVVETIRLRARIHESFA
jgi:hypothetical protein